MRQAVNNKRVNAQLKTMYKNIERSEARKSNIRRSQEDMAYAQRDQAKEAQYGAIALASKYSKR